jgi:hypothetical protein
MKQLLLKFLLVTAVCGVATPVFALTIVPIFDTSITSDVNDPMIEAGINAAISQMESYIANPVTDYINFQEGGGLGGSSTYFSSIPYTTYLSDLQNNQTLSAADNTALSSLPAGPNNPVNGAANVNVAVSLLRAVGGFGAGYDSTITLNTSIMNLSRTGSQNPSFYDLEAVALHEITETLGAGGAGSGIGGGTVGTLDLFRYSASGIRSYTTSPTETAYFSINGGATSLRPFNQAGGGSDYADWAGTAAPHVQDAYGTPGSQPNLDGIELEALDIVGYNLTTTGTALELSAVPETGGSLALMCVGLIVAVAGYHKRTHKTG